MRKLTEKCVKGLIYLLSYVYLLIFRGRFKEIEKLEEYHELFKIIVEPELQMAVPASKILLPMLENRYRSGVSSLRFIKDRLNMNLFGIIFFGFSPFHETFNRKIVQLIENGSIRKWILESLKTKTYKIEEEEIGPEVLTMDHLEVSWIIIVIALTLCIFTFGFELLMRLCRKRKCFMG